MINIGKDLDGSSASLSQRSQSIKKSRPKTAGPSQLDSLMDVITGSYLCGQWPREFPRTQHACMTDKATQTPGVWTDDWRGLKKHRRSSSWSSADHRREITKLCLQVRQNVVGIQHNKEKEKEAVSSLSQVQTKLNPASIANGSIAKPAMCRLSSCNDSINHELESVFVTDTWGKQHERELQDGRCAPVPPHPSSDPHMLCADAHLCSHGKRSLHAFSASDPTDDNVNESSSPLPLLVSSPKPNNSFVFKRVPPEGCEKVTVFEEIVSHGFPIFSCPDRNRVSFVPTGAGPFCPVRTPASLPTPLQLQVPERSHHGVVQPGQGPRQPPTASIAGAGSSSGAGRRDPPGTEGPGHRLGC